jgi:hypothetical protein
MPSIRCANCNFLNFDTAASCKKCKEPLGIAAVSGVSTAANAPNVYSGGNMASFQPQPRQPQQQQLRATPPRRQPASSYHNPPPPNFYDDLRGEHPAASVKHDYSRTFTVSIPPVCVKCGNDDGLTMKKFKNDYTPPLAYLGFLLGGVLPLLIVILICRKRHKMNGLFCAGCWNWFKVSGAISTLTALAALGVMFVAMVAGVITNSALTGIIIFLTALGIGIWGSYFAKKISPKYVKTNRKQIYIDIPNYGEVDFTASGAL